MQFIHQYSTLCLPHGILLQIKVDYPQNNLEQAKGLTKIAFLRQHR